ncbi:hypothetical protein [Paraburkholderia hospita]|uniref:hypothetical protein n=1 Tax=Paraburkholderia hospita TaxID=169430 RepID=UPI0012601D37|nr:hypothetical protein [Paraburkholderia hospita]
MLGMKQCAYEVLLWEQWKFCWEWVAYSERMDVIIAYRLDVTEPQKDTVYAEAVDDMFNERQHLFLSYRQHFGTPLSAGSARADPSENLKISIRTMRFLCRRASAIVVASSRAADIELSA